MLLADQVAEEALLDVVDVLDPLGHVAVGHLQRTCSAYRRITTLTAYSAVVVLVLDLVDDLVDERLVAEHAEVEVEDPADLLAVLRR